jgi:hypothetical protein
MTIVQFDTALPEYAAPGERPVLQDLVRICLEDNNRVSVWDGEELSVQGCNNNHNILKSLSQTDMDQLEVYDKDGNYRGFFSLIYNNGSEHEPMIVISDYSANEWTERVYRRLEEVYGGYEL